MRVVHVMASGERGGGTDHLLGLLPELRQAGVDSSAVTSPSGPLANRLEALGFAVGRVNMMRSRLDPRIARRLRGEVLSRKPDLVHCHGTRAAFMAVKAVFPVPWIYTAHGLSYRQSGTPVRRAARIAAETLICRLADEVVSVSESDLDDLRRRHALPGGHGVHIPNAVDTARFRPRDRGQARRTLGIGDDEFVVGTVARLVPQKAVGDLVEAMVSLPGGTLVVVGEGPHRDRLERQAREAGVRTTFLGSRDDVEHVLPSFDVFVLPSRWEGEPLALLEAMAAGLPCVATATSGSKEVLRDPALGVLVPLGEPAAIARAVAVLRSDPALRDSLGNAARQAVEGRSWRSTAARLLQVYDEVLARHA